jgi:hypothetical protein
VSRDQFNITSLEITGDKGHPVTNQFIKQQPSSEKLAVIYPGMRYTCDKPLLYFTTELLLSKGFDVLQLWSNYGSKQFELLSQAEKTIQIISDGQALLGTGRQAGAYTRVLLCGKSLGTLTMAFILNEHHDLTDLMTVWFTPLIHLPPVSDSILNTDSPAFIAGSLADTTFSSGPIDQITSKSNITTLITDQADHSLEIPGDILHSLNILDLVITKLSGFIN